MTSRHVVLSTTSIHSYKKTSLGTYSFSGVGGLDGFTLNVQRFTRAFRTGLFLYISNHSALLSSGLGNTSAAPADASKAFARE